MRFLPVLAFLFSFAAHARDQMPLMLPEMEPELPFTQSQSLFPGRDGLTLRVPQYREIIRPGETIECMLDDKGQFGYLITQEANGDVFIEGISGGQREGVASRQKAEVKEYGAMQFYVSVYSRFRNTGTYFEIMLDKKVKAETGKIGGNMMFTETYYTKNGDKEEEEFKPIAKRPVVCN